MDRKQYENYVNEKLHPLLEKMLIDILQQRPSDPIPFLISWLQKKQSEGGIAAAHAGAKHSQHQDDDEEKASSDEEDNEDDYVDDLPTAKEKDESKGKKPTGRSSVSAEAFGQFNQKKAFKPKIVQKKPEIVQRITKRLSEAFMFSALDENERKIVIDAMEEKKFAKDEYVIKQGDDGDVLYVVDEGELKCEKVFKKGDPPTFLKVYKPGESFGELALLYNTPRAATIIAQTNSVLYSLDRDTFNNIVKDAAAKKRERYEEFLKKIEILKEMDPYERNKIADALKTITLKKDSLVVKEGENGDDFYMIEEGTLQALKTLKPGGQPEVVKEYQNGDYFGELALIKNVPRQATIKCTSDVKLATLDRLAFKRLLGPIDKILARNAEAYKKFAQK
ncbi:hypothetical protein ABPG72_004539 [Tetrahymena utriculariae]